MVDFNEVNHINFSSSQGERVNTRKFLVVLTIIITTIYVTESVGVSETNGGEEIHLVEVRNLEVIFVGVNSQNVSENYLFNQLNKTVESRFSFEDIISYMVVSPKILFIQQSIRNEFVEKVFKQSNQVNDSDYYIQYKDFLSAFKETFLTEKLNRKTIQIYVLSFSYSGSPFGFENVYLNYSWNDIDTKRESEVMTYAEGGVSFELEKEPVLGIITSSRPMFDCDEYPLIQDLLRHAVTIYMWNQRLGRTLEHVLWCRLNLSPTFRYKAYKKLSVHLSLVGLDDKYSIYEIYDYLNVSYIKKSIQELLMITEVEVTTVITQATNELRELSGNRELDYFQWSDTIAEYFRYNGQYYWDKSYKMIQGTYLDESDIFIVVMVGDNDILPWSDEYVGLSHYAYNDSEFGGLTTITINYNTLFEKNEGLSRTTVHEIGHLFGLMHPHDYWHPIQETLYYSYEWGYTTSPMTYLVTGSAWDYFDYLTVARFQFLAILQSMTKL